jgi:hypothetical protein
MKTSHLIALTATIAAFAAPTASARPLSDPPGSHTSKPTAPTSASIAAHRDQITVEQWQRTHAPSPATSLEDRTGNGGFPVAYVLIGLTVPLGFVLLRFVGKATTHNRRRTPTHLA